MSQIFFSTHFARSSLPTCPFLSAHYWLLVYTRLISFLDIFSQVSFNSDPVQVLRACKCHSLHHLILAPLHWADHFLEFCFCTDYSFGGMVQFPHLLLSLFQFLRHFFLIYSQPKPVFLPMHLHIASSWKTKQWLSLCWWGSKGDPTSFSPKKAKLLKQQSI